MNSIPTEMTADELADVQGGNFAYDVGRVIRFFAIAGPNGNYAGMAVADWIITDATNSK